MSCEGSSGNGFVGSPPEPGGEARGTYVCYYFAFGDWKPDAGNAFTGFVPVLVWLTVHVVEPITRFILPTR